MSNIRMAGISLPIIVFATALLGLFLFLAVPRIIASSSPSDGVIHSCVNANSGEIKIVDQGDSCKKNGVSLAWNAVGIQGEQGIQGIQGLKGDKGNTGNTGPKGDTGPKGNTGIQGIQGLKGDKGNTGNTGPKGSTGAKGATGATGAQGAPGPNAALGSEVFTSPAGGSGGSAFTFRCSPNGSSIGIGLRGRVGDDIDRTSLRCRQYFGLSILSPSPGPETIAGTVGGPGGGGSVNYNLICATGSVMTGVFGRSNFHGFGPVVDTLGVRCTPIGGGPISSLGPVGLVQGSGVFTRDCPAGKVVTGILGRQGGLLDRIQLICR